MKETKVAILGLGWVGKSMQKLFPHATIYDPNIVEVREEETDEVFYQPEEVSWSSGYKYTRLDNKDLVNQCDVAFIATPTPNIKAPEGASISNTRPGNNDGEGALDTSIVEDCVSWCECPLIVIRSTVNPGTSDYLVEKYHKNIVVQPEYLGETPNHPFLDPKTRQFMIIGGGKENTRKLIDLYATVYNANVNIRQVSCYEAEVIKLSENRAIFWKVMQCQELYDACEASVGKADYYTIREAVYSDDPRFNLWFSFVYPDKRGCNSKCMPKDVYAWASWAESLGLEPKMTRALLERNKEWIQG